MRILSLADFVRLEAQYAELRRYVESYSMPERFWAWALGVKEIEVVGAVGRDVGKTEADMMIHDCAVDIAEQVLVREDAIRWAEKFIGKNGAHKGTLKKNREGLYGIGCLYGHYKERALYLQREESASLLRNGPLFLTKPLQVWPPNADKLFSKGEHFHRIRLSTVSEEERAAWGDDPSVVAGEIQCIGWAGKVIATAALTLKEVRKASHA